MEWLKAQFFLNGHCVDFIHMPKGKPKKGYRKPGGGRKQNKVRRVTLTVRGFRSQKLMTRYTKKAAATKLSEHDKYELQNKIDSFSDDQFDQLFKFLDFQDQHSEASIDLDVMEGTKQRDLAKFVDGLCNAAIATLQGKVNRLTAEQIEEVIMFLGSDIEGGDAMSKQMEMELDWSSLSASRKQELDKLLDKMLNPYVVS